MIIGENETFMGEEGLLKQHGVKVSVLNNSRCKELMNEFIRNNARLWNEDIGV